MSASEQFDRDMQKAILYGLPGAASYSKLEYKYPIAKLIETPAFRAAFKTSLANKLLPRLKEGEKILNTNIHPDELRLLGIPPAFILPVAPEIKRKPTSPRVRGAENKRKGKKP